MDVNLKGVFLGIKYAVPHMINNGGGSIINTPRCLAWQPAIEVVGPTPLRRLRTNADQEGRSDYAPYKIRVNNVVPGDIALTGGANTPDESWLDPKTVKEMETNQPLPKMGMPIDVAYAALYLASDESAYVTGADLMVDGGNDQRGIR